MKDTLVQDALVLVYDVITRPRSAMAGVVSPARLRVGLFVWAFMLLLPIFSATAQLGRFSLSLLLGTTIGGIVFFLLQVMFIHGAASLFGGKGPVRGLAAGLCFANVPLCFATLAESFIFLLPSPLVHLLSLIAALWSIYLDVLAIKENYGLGTGRSIVALFLPVVIIVVILVIIAVCFVVSLASLVKGL